MGASPAGIRGRRRQGARSRRPPRPLRLSNGQGLQVTLDLDRGQIHQMIGAVLPTVSHPEPVNDRGEVPAEASGHDIWAELLDDLGAYDHLLRDISPQVRLESVETDGRQATITLVDGESASTFTYLLEDGEVPFGLAVDLATDFLNELERD